MQKILVAAFTCLAVLFVLDQTYFYGEYFDSAAQMISGIMLHFR